MKRSALTWFLPSFSSPPRPDSPAAFVQRSASAPLAGSQLDSDPVGRPLSVGAGSQPPTGAQSEAREALGVAGRDRAAEAGSITPSGSTSAAAAFENELVADDFRDSESEAPSHFRLAVLNVAVDLQGGAGEGSARDPGRPNDPGAVASPNNASKSAEATSVELDQPGRARRKRLVKGRTLSTKYLGPGPASSHEDELASPVAHARPQTRAECANGLRPCPYVSCRYHLYLEVSPRTGSLKLNFPDLEVWELSETCALDVAERGAQTTEHLGELLNLTPERARQLEQQALREVAETFTDEHAEAPSRSAMPRASNLRARAG